MTKIAEAIRIVTQLDSLRGLIMPQHNSRVLGNKHTGNAKTIVHTDVDVGN